MARPRNLINLVAVFGFLLFAVGAPASLVVEQGSVSVTFYQVGEGVVGEGLEINSNPFIQSHSFSHFNSVNSASYYFAWMGDEANIHVSTTQALQGFQGNVHSSGRFYITPSVDSALSIITSYTYDHPSQSQLWGEADVALTVRIGNAGGPLVFHDSESDGSVGLGPAFGTLTFQGSALLSAGTTYHLTYFMKSMNFNPPPPDAVWAGNGFIDLTIRPIPEPAAAMFVLPLLGVAILRPGPSHRF